MTIEDLQIICRALPDVTEDIKWGHDYCFNVGGKMFLVVGINSIPMTASFKTADEVFEEITERNGFAPAPYLGRYKWVYTDDISRLAKKEWVQVINESYRLIAAKLPTKKK